MGTPNQTSPCVRDFAAESAASSARADGCQARANGFNNQALLDAHNRAGNHSRLIAERIAARLQESGGRVSLPYIDGAEDRQTIGK